MSNLTLRVLVALVGIPLVIFVTLAGGVYFLVFVSLISLLALLEFFKLAGVRDASPQVWSGVVLGFCVNLAFFHNPLQHGVVRLFNAWGVGIPFPSMMQLLVILLLLGLPLILLVELFRNNPTPVRNIGVTLFGLGYVSFFMGCLIGLRELFNTQDFPVHRYFPLEGMSVPPGVAETIYAYGGYTLLALFAAIWICDSAAYFAGVKWGRHKLFERVSPKKTWEGAIAGLIGAMIAFVVAREITLPYMSLGNALVCGGIVGVFGQLGDMVESLIKRDSGVKDSSHLIPGHGGVLDRFDSLMFTAPLMFFYLDFIVFS